MSGGLRKLSGATHVLPLAAQLGQQLAGRVDAPDSHVYQIGRYHDLDIGELALGGRRLRAQLRAAGHRGRPSWPVAAWGQAGIGARTGLTVIAQRADGEVLTQLSASTPLVAGAELIMLGEQSQREHFAREFGLGAE